MIWGIILRDFWGNNLRGLLQGFEVDELACFSEVSRQLAFERFELLRAHLEDGIALAAIAREAKLSYRTLQHWLERYRTYGLVGLTLLRTSGKNWSPGGLELLLLLLPLLLLLLAKL